MRDTCYFVILLFCYIVRLLCCYDKRVDIRVSVVVMCNDTFVIVGYDRRRSAWLSSAPVDIEYGNNSIEQ